MKNWKLFGLQKKSQMFLIRYRIIGFHSLHFHFFSYQLDSEGDIFNAPTIISYYFQGN